MEHRRPLALLLGVVVAVMVAGCDGSIHVRGRVHARSPNDTMPPSVAVVDRTGIDTTGLAPVSGATVTLFLRAADTSATRTDTLIWVRRDTTLATGSFDMFELGPPSSYTAALRIERIGYRSVTVAFTHRPEVELHRAVVVLTPVSR